MHARELTKRLRKASIHNVTVNSLHPGVIDSELSRSAKPKILHSNTAPFVISLLKSCCLEKVLHRYSILFYLIFSSMLYGFLMLQQVREINITLKFQTLALGQQAFD